MGFDLYSYSLKIRESIGILIPKVGVHLGVWRFIPSHFPTLSGEWNVTPRLPFGSHFCKFLPWSRAQG
jgi:hypothetical protein